MESTVIRKIEFKFRTFLTKRKIKSKVEWKQLSLKSFQVFELNITIGKRNDYSLNILYLNNLLCSYSKLFLKTILFYQIYFYNVFFL